MPYFLVFVKYPSVVDPVAKVAMLARNHDSIRAMYHGGMEAVKRAARSRPASPALGL
jgi:hypothetical protein